MAQPSGPGLSPLARRLEAQHRPVGSAVLSDDDVRQVLRARGWRIVADDGRWLVRLRTASAAVLGSGSTPAAAVASALRNAR